MGVSRSGRQGTASGRARAGCSYEAERADGLAKIPPLATRLIKRAVNASSTLSLDEGMLLERDLIAYRFAARAQAERGDR